MTIKTRDELLGGHVHIGVFIGKDADHLQKAGDVCVDADQWTQVHSMFACGAQVAGFEYLCPGASDCAEAVLMFGVKRPVLEDSK